MASVMSRRRLSFVSWVALMFAITAITAIASLSGLPRVQAEARTPTAMPVVHMLGPTHPPGLDPSILTIHEGDRVTFENDATPKGVHAVIAEDSSFASPPLQTGKRWTTAAFPHQGSHIYHDPTAYAQVVGIILVVPASTALQPPSAPGSVATVVARARAARGGHSGASSASSASSASPVSSFFSHLSPWLLIPVALGLGGLAYLIYRVGRRRRNATKIGPS